MIVYKFGGASVKDAKGIKNLGSIVSSEENNLVIVISAFGKMTNAFEEIVKKYFYNEPGTFISFENVKQYHDDILSDLFEDKSLTVFKEVSDIFERLKFKLSRPSTTGNYDFEYDQIVCLGEILSTTIVSAYLNHINIVNEWLDIRSCLITDATFREGLVDWNTSTNLLKEKISFNNCSKYVTQGFISATKDGMSTTLGREGSDYTAAVIANVLDADETIIWKDVPGILNADPNIFDETEKLNEISYLEAIELSYSGAKVIHPKTIKPLHNKKIPLKVKSFLAPEEEGTQIYNCKDCKELVPVFIVKHEQLLLTVLPRDFSFVVEDSLSKIFALFYKYRLKVNLIQHSAIRFSVCIDNDMERINKVLEELREEFEVLYNEGLELVTIRHYNQKAIDKITTNKEVYLEQKTRHSVRLVLRSV